MPGPDRRPREQRESIDATAGVLGSQRSRTPSVQSPLASTPEGSNNNNAAAAIDRASKASSPEDKEGADANVVRQRRTSLKKVNQRRAFVFFDKATRTQRWDSRYH